MYDNEDNRIYHLGSIVGISPEIVQIFTSRIPKTYIKITSSGRTRTHDGDKVVVPVLDRLYDLKGIYSDDSLDMQNISVLYKLKHPNPGDKTISFKRFVLNEFLVPVFSKQKTTISNRRVFWPSQVPILQLGKEEVDILYDWLTKPISI